MKQIFLIAIAGLLCTTGFGQYKKAGFFSSKGRTIGLGTTAYMMGTGSGLPLGYSLEMSRESDMRRVFTYGSFTFLPAYNFSYQSPGIDNNTGKSITVPVTGRSGFNLQYAFNVGLFLLKNDGEQPFKPFVSLGFNANLSDGVHDYLYPEGTSIDKYPSSVNYRGGIRGGGGCIYQPVKPFSVKLDLGYTFLVNMDAVSEAGTFQTYRSHPAATVTLRYHFGHTE